MEKYFAVLRKCMLFMGISEENLSGLLSCLGARVNTFAKKETVSCEGDRAGLIGIVLSGGVQIEQNDYYGNRTILSNAEPSEIFGESFACAGEESVPVSVVATEDSEIMQIDCNHILTQCTNACGFHRQLIYNLVKILAHKNIMLHKKSDITSKRTTREKLMAYLFQEAKKNGSKSFDIPYDRQELADYLEVERSGLSAEISKLRDEGVLKSRKSHFVLL